MDFEQWADDEIHLLSTGTALRRPSDHHSIYKYVDLNTKTSWQYFEGTVLRSALVGGTANSLNDPFELSPFVFDDLRPEVIASSLGDFGLVDRLDGGAFDSRGKYSDVDSYRTLATTFLEKLVRNSRIVAFCDRSDSPLLWSHYANSYKGACLHFLGKAISKPALRGVRFGYVNYATYRPTVPLSLALRLTKLSRGERRYYQLIAEAEKTYFFSKAIDWSYESEIRLVYDVTKAKEMIFDEGGLMSVILGPKMENDEKDRVREIVARSPRPELPIREARLSANSFSVEIS